MPAIRPQLLVRPRAFVAGLFAAILSAGCATPPVAPALPEPEAHTQSLPSVWIPVVRYGRYTLVELAPDAAQNDLLLQVVDHSMPPTLPATVGDALRYLLLRSGYRLCENDVEADALYGLPLPAVHQNLGPITLRDALRTVAGPAWDLRIDDGACRVCFAPRVDDSSLAPLHHLPVPAEPAATVIRCDRRRSCHDDCCRVTAGPARQPVPPSPADVRVLRLGEIESGGQLESIAGRTAVFRFDGQTRAVDRAVGSGP